MLSGLDRRAHQRQSGRSVPRPDDRHGRRREAAEDAERDRADDPAGRDDARVPARDGHAAALLDLQRRDREGGHAGDDHRARRAARVPDSDDDRRSPVGDRRRRHGPDDARQRDRHVRAAPSRPPATATCCCSTRPARSPTATARRRRSIRCPASRRNSSPRRRCLASLGDETPERQEHRRAGEARLRHRAAAARARPVHDHPVLGADADERRHLPRPRAAQGCARRDPRLDRRAGRRASIAEVTARVDDVARRGARRRSWSPKAGTCSA